MLIPLGLILDTENQPDVKIFPFKRTILPPAKNDIEREERLAVLWTTVMMLEISSASSGWAGALAMDEVVCSMPALERAVLTLPPRRLDFLLLIRISTRA